MMLFAVQNSSILSLFILFVVMYKKSNANVYSFKEQKLHLAFYNYEKTLSVHYSNLEKVLSCSRSGPNIKLKY